MNDLTDLLNRPVAEAAADLLGWRLRSDIRGSTTEITITEVEAYGGTDDPASHAHRGQTSRNTSMFSPAGTLYVYLSYGVHWCANVVTGAEGSGQAVLLRGGRPTIGTAIMEQRRGRVDHLVDGPGKLCQALGIDGHLDGTSLEDGPVRLLPAVSAIKGTVLATQRTGITKAVDRHWRFTITE